MYSKRRKVIMEQTNKIFEIKWPFWQCQAILPNAIGHDIFVWLYLSILVRIVKAEANPSNRVTEKQMKDTRDLIREKFSKELISNSLLKEIENRVKTDFCEETKFKDYDLKPEVNSFLNSFEYLFGDDVEVKTIYKDAVSGAIIPFFEPVYPKYTGIETDQDKDEESSNGDDNDTFIFENNSLRPKEPSARLVLKALGLSKSIENTSDPLVPTEAKESVFSEIAYDEDEEIYEDDTIDFIDDSFSEKAASANDESSCKKKKTIKVIEDTYKKTRYSVLVRMDNESGELVVDPPIEFPNEKGIIAWFNILFKRAMLTNKSLAKKINDFFPKPIIQKKVSQKTMIELFSKNGGLEKCQELYEIVSHSKTYSDELRLEVIRINDNYRAISGFFHVGRLLDLLGKTIPDNIIRSDIDYDTFKFFMSNACDDLGLDQETKFKLIDRYIYREYSRQNKKNDKLPFKELLANAILNNLACKNNPFLYREVIKDAWDLYGARSNVDHPNGDIRLSENDIIRLTKLSKFIVSIQGGKII